MYLPLVVFMIETLVAYNVPPTNSAELIKSTASVDVSVTNLSMTTSFPEFSHKEAWVNARPKLINEHFSNNEDVLFKSSDFGASRPRSTALSESLIYKSQATAKT